MQVAMRQKSVDTVELAVLLSTEEVKDGLKRAAILVAYEHKVEPDPKRQPVDVVREVLGKDEAAFLFDEAVMARCAPFALADREVDIVGEPKYACAQHVREGHTFEFQMTCVPVPKFELSSYDPVEITMPALAVSDDQVEEQIQALVKASADRGTDDSHSTVEKGDSVELELETIQDGKPVRALCSKARVYNTGSLSMPDDFDEAIVGMDVGETKSFEFEGPSFELDANGQPVMESYRSTVTVKRILSTIEPEVTDAWAARVMPNCSTVAQLREHIRSRLLQQQAKEHQKQKEQLCAAELAKRFNSKIPDAVYDAAMSEARKTLHKSLKEQGQTLEDFLKQQGMEEQQLTMSVMMQVREQMVRQFSLDAFARHEGLSVEDADIDSFFDAISPNNAVAARKDFERSGKLFAAKGAALRLKANRLLAEQAVVHDAAAHRVG